MLENDKLFPRKEFVEIQKSDVKSVQIASEQEALLKNVTLVTAKRVTVWLNCSQFVFTIQAYHGKIRKTIEFRIWNTDIADTSTLRK